MCSERGWDPLLAALAAGPAAAAAASLQSLLDAVVGGGRAVDARSEATIASRNLKMIFYVTFSTDGLVFHSCMKGVATKLVQYVYTLA